MVLMGRFYLYLLRSVCPEDFGHAVCSGELNAMIWMFLPDGVAFGVLDGVAVSVERGASTFCLHEITEFLDDVEMLLPGNLRLSLRVGEKGGTIESRLTFIGVGDDSPAAAFVDLEVFAMFGDKRIEFRAWPRALLDVSRMNRVGDFEIGDLYGACVHTYISSIAASPLASSPCGSKASHT